VDNHTPKPIILLMPLSLVCQTMGNGLIEVPIKIHIWKNGKIY